MKPCFTCTRCTAARDGPLHSGSSLPLFLIFWETNHGLLWSCSVEPKLQVLTVSSTNSDSEYDTWKGTNQEEPRVPYRALGGGTKNANNRTNLVENVIQIWSTTEWRKLRPRYISFILPAVSAHVYIWLFPSNPTLHYYILLITGAWTGERWWQAKHPSRRHPPPDPE